MQIISLASLTLYMTHQFVRSFPNTTLLEYCSCGSIVLGLSFLGESPMTTALNGPFPRLYSPVNLTFASPGLRWSSARKAHAGNPAMN